jgi:hypothetical protein
MANQFKMLNQSFNYIKQAPINWALNITLLLSVLTLSGNPFTPISNKYSAPKTEISSTVRRQKRGILFSSFIARQKASIQAFLQYSVEDLLSAYAKA